jgi:hypothetical protein
MIFEAMSREDVERVGKENASNTEQAFVLGWLCLQFGSQFLQPSNSEYPVDSMHSQLLILLQLVTR